MQLVSRKNFIIFLAAILVIALGFMSITLAKKSMKPRVEQTFQEEMQKVESQSPSDQTEDIEEDLNETNLDSVDKELQDVDKELNTTL